MGDVTLCRQIPNKILLICSLVHIEGDEVKRKQKLNQQRSTADWVMLHPSREFLFM